MSIIKVGDVIGVNGRQRFILKSTKVRFQYFEMEVSVRIRSLEESIRQTENGLRGLKIELTIPRKYITTCLNESDYRKETLRRIKNNEQEISEYKNELSQLRSIYYKN
jgi:hypothetical protein